MHSLKESLAMVILGALSVNVAAAPAPAANNAPSIEFSRMPLADHTAIVNVYSGEGCGGDSTQFTATGAGTGGCHTVGGNSIQVSARYVHIG